MTLSTHSDMDALRRRLLVRVNQHCTLHLPEGVLMLVLGVLAIARRTSIKSWQALYEVFTKFAPVVPAGGTSSRPA